MGFVQIGEQSPRRLYGGLGLRRDLVQPRGELSLHPLPGLRQGKPLLPGLLHPAGELPGQVVQQPLIPGPGGEDDLPGGKPGQFIDRVVHPALRGKEGEEDLPRGDIPKAQPRPLHPHIEGGQEVVSSLLQHVLLYEGAGGDHPDDLPVHQALGLGGVLGLLTDGHLVALGDEAGNVCLGGVVGHPAHGGALLGGLVPVPGGEGEVQLRCGGFGILVKHLIEIPQTEEEEAVGVLVLDGQVLSFHGGEFCHSITLS